MRPSYLLRRIRGRPVTNHLRRLRRHPRYQVRTSTAQAQMEIQPNNVEQKSENDQDPIPRSELVQAFKVAAVPMVAFGFMDNMIMIFAGDYIDNSIGFTFGLATLVAAGLGQCLSDTSGVIMGNSVESFAGERLRPPNVTAQQRMCGNFRMATTAGALIGVITGCLLGLVNLLFIDLERKERREKQRELDGIFELVMGKGPEVFECEAASLFVYDPEAQILWTKVSSTGHLIQVDIDQPSIVTHVYKTGEIINIIDENDPRVFREGSKGFVTKTMLAAPVHMEDDGTDKCVAVIEIMNKHTSEHFTDDDVHMLKVLTNHVGLFCKSFSFEECAREIEEQSRLTLLKNFFKGWANF